MKSFSVYKDIIDNLIRKNIIREILYFSIFLIKLKEKI